jgi:hypothetical protein
MDNRNRKIEEPMKGIFVPILNLQVIEKMRKCFEIP